MQKLQKHCIFFLPQKKPFVLLTNSCKPVQVYSKHMVEQQMWKEYPVLKEKKLQDIARLVLPEMPSLPPLPCLFS